MGGCQCQGWGFSLGWLCQGQPGGLCLQGRKQPSVRGHQGPGGASADASWLGALLLLTHCLHLGEAARGSCHSWNLPAAALWGLEVFALCLDTEQVTSSLCPLSLITPGCCSGGEKRLS